MAVSRLEHHLVEKLQDLEKNATGKGPETVITAVIPAEGKKGPRYTVDGFGKKAFLRMNSNAYLGLSLREELIAAEEKAARAYGCGPGAVRFISGTYLPHVELEKRLARFHGREAAMIFSSAYAAVMGVITPLIEPDTIVISDALNHNCIINAVRLARPQDKVIYRHLDMGDLEQCIAAAAGRCCHLVVATDGIFSMRGDHAPLDKICAITAQYASAFERGITTLVDDSHGVGAFGETGRGTIEYTGATGIDILVATLGKALGVNGGYVAGGKTTIAYLRETSPFYVYSNPISPAEACAAMKALEIVDSPQGKTLLAELRNLIQRFEKGLVTMGYEIIPSDHPVVPLMIRNTQRTADMVAYLFENGILATGLKFPVVPRGDEEIRFQVTADHTTCDIDCVLEVLDRYRRK
jgi:glycine C-acetyltransferase